MSNKMADTTATAASTASPKPVKQLSKMFTSFRAKSAPKAEVPAYRFIVSMQGVCDALESWR